MYVQIQACIIIDVSTKFHQDIFLRNTNCAKPFFFLQSLYTSSIESFYASKHAFVYAHTHTHTHTNETKLKAQEQHLLPPSDGRGGCSFSPELSNFLHGGPGIQFFFRTPQNLKRDTTPSSSLSQHHHLSLSQYYPHHPPCW